MSKFSYTLAQIAKHLELSFVGDGSIVIKSVAPIETAVEHQLTFLSSSKYHKYLETSQASAFILHKKDLPAREVNAIICGNPYFVYAKVAQLFEASKIAPKGIHQTAIIGKDCEIHPEAYIGAYCVLGQGVKIAKGAMVGAHSFIDEYCELGENTQLMPKVTLYRNTKIGKHCLLHSGVVIGADGFGFAPTEHGWYKVPQLGYVLINDFVEIGANTTIDRGAIEATVIGTGVKIDNQVQIGHNVRIGDHTIIAGCVGIAGSVKIGRNCMLGGSVGISDHLEITDNVVITAMTGISKNITSPGIYSSGMQAEKREMWRRNTIHFKHLNEYVKRLKKLEKFAGFAEAKKRT